MTLGAMETFVGASGGVASRDGGDGGTGEKGTESMAQTSQTDSTFPPAAHTGPPSHHRVPSPAATGATVSSLGPRQALGSEDQGLGVGWEAPGRRVPTAEAGAAAPPGPAGKGGPSKPPGSWGALTSSSTCWRWAQRLPSSSPRGPQAAAAFPEPSPPAPSAALGFWRRKPATGTGRSIPLGSWLRNVMPVMLAPGEGPGPCPASARRSETPAATVSWTG